ncbi:MAG: aspartyl protease family protein [Cyclobacteriaceae bacterium]|nr:aspartyl protease family protein [Cyclobacteriaceae bacterium]MDW8330789.1 aspartyl protease family protein [Cyclobacteriaceae bacterium]
MLRFSLIFWFILLYLSGFAQQINLGFSLAEGRKRVDIPVDIVNNLVIVPVILNETLPLKFIVDTGVRTAILTQKAFSDILQLPYSRKYSISGPGGEKIIDAYVTNNVSLRLPGVLGRGHALLVLEEDYLELRNYLGTDVHGILGYELFSRFVVQLDYQRKIMTLMMPDKFKPSKKFTAIPLRIQDTKPYLLAPISIDSGHTLNAKLLVDTGASHSLMLETDSDPRIHLPARTVSGVLGRGLGGAITGKIGRIQSIELGNRVIRNVLANFPDPESYFPDSLITSRVDRNGTLGGELLSRFTVVINFPQEKIYLKPNNQLRREFYFNMSGLNIRAKGASLNMFEVSEVRAGSAGEEAGILPGDLILSINNMPTSSMKLEHINALFNSKPGRKLRLTISRAGQNKSVEVILNQQI